jgi:predicted Zn-dependent peptidase
MKRVVLPNGLTVIYKNKPGNSVVVEVMIKVGSNDEQKEERGISHFLEHILFEGTRKRPNNKLISNEIEKIGGGFNAYTSNEKTCFYVKVLKKHFSIAVDVLADVLQNSLFKENDIEKEKKVVIKEIDMVNDEPRFYQWLLLQESLFDKHPCRFPTYGDKKVITDLTKEKTIEFFKKYYVPNNMVISIVGDVKNWEQEIQKQFYFSKGKAVKHTITKEPITNKRKEKKVKKKIINTHIVLGFKTVPRDNKDSYVLDVINGVLGRGQSGRMFNEIRSKRGLAYDVGTQSIREKTFGYFAVYAIINKKNVPLVKKLIFDELEKLSEISEQDLKEAKDFIEGDYLLLIEDAQKIADQLLFWEQIKSSKLMDEYVKNIKKVSRKDVKRVAEKYFKNYSLVVLQGK